MRSSLRRFHQANLRRVGSRPRSSKFATTLLFQLTLPLTRHFERWQGNWIRREPQATENPVTRFPSGGSMQSDCTGKNRYSCDEPRNLSCVREYRTFSVVRVVIPSQSLFRKISRLFLTYYSYNFYSLRRLPPLEMTNQR